MPDKSRIKLKFRESGTYQKLILFLPIPLFLLTFYKSITAITIHGFTWHCIIPFISGFLIYDQRAKVKSAKYSSNHSLGSLLIILALFFMFAGEVTSTLIISEVSIVLGVWGCILFYGGIKLFIKLSGPLLYLLFISSATEGVFDILTPHFRQLSASLATSIAHFSGFHVILSETYIRLPYMVLNVADQCSGVNHFISLLAISLPLAIITQSRLLARLLLIASSLPVALFSNSIRVFIIIIFNYNRHEFTHGPKNLLVTGSGFFIGLIVLMIFSAILGRLKPKDTKISQDGKTPEAPLSILNQIKLKTSLFLSLLLLAGYLLNIFWSTKDGSSKLHEFSSGSDLFQSVNVSHIPGLDSLPEADKEQKIRYTDSQENTFYLYVGWYARQMQNREIAGYSYDRVFYNSRHSTHLKSSIKFRFCKSSLGNENFRYLIVYRSQGWYTAIPMVSKAYTILDALLHRSTSASIIIVAFPDERMITDEYLQKIVDTIFPAIETSLGN